MGVKLGMKTKLSPWFKKFLCIFALMFVGFALVGITVPYLTIVYAVIMVLVLLGMLVVEIVRTIIRTIVKIKELLWNTKLEIYIHN